MGHWDRGVGQRGTEGWDRRGGQVVQGSGTGGGDTDLSVEVLQHLELVLSHQTGVHQVLREASVRNSEDTYAKCGDK